MIWRRLRIPANTSLAQLHEIIQIAYNWDNDYLHQFHIFGKDYGISYAGGIMFSDDARKIYLDDFEFDVGDKFRYEYNFFIDNIVDIRMERIITTAKNSSVFCLKGKGMPDAKEHDDLEPTLKLLKTIIDAKGNIAMSDIELFIDEIIAARFIRGYVNKRFQSELVKSI